MTWSKVSRHQRGYGTQWDKLRRQVMARDHGLCQPCKRAGRVTEADAVDHIIPKARGGSDDLSNLQAICDDCHRTKTEVENGGKPRPRIGLDGWPV